MENKNTIKQEFCAKHGLSERQFQGKEKYNGHLDLRGLTSIPEGFNPTVGGHLDLDSLTSIPEGFNPTVGGCLNLSRLTSIPEGFNPTVGGYLGLGGLTSIPEGFNPTVGGHLDLDSLTSIPEGFNPTVGGCLNLSRLTSIPEGFNPTVGEHLYLDSGLSTHTQTPPQMLSWHGGKFIKVDGIFTEVVSRRGNVWRVKKVHEDNIFYLVSDGNGKYAHGDTLKAAKDDLVYKLTGGIEPTKYKGLPLDTKLSFEEAVTCYRVITKACSFGTKNFIESAGIKRKAYTIAEMIKITKGQYGSKEFASFFG